MSDSAVDVAEDRSRLDQCPTGADRFPDPIGTLGEPDRTVDNLKEMCFPYRMYSKALRCTGGLEKVCGRERLVVASYGCSRSPVAFLLCRVCCCQESVDYIMANCSKPPEFWKERYAFSQRFRM